MNLHKEAQEIAREALSESNGDFDAAVDFIYESCDGHAVSIYYGRAIDFCATHDTSEGEAYLEDYCGGIAQEGDTFGAIACRIAFATLLVAAQEALAEMEQENA